MNGMTESQVYQFIAKIFPKTRNKNCLGLEIPSLHLTKLSKYKLTQYFLEPFNKEIHKIEIIRPISYVGKLHLNILVCIEDPLDYLSWKNILKYTVCIAYFIITFYWFPAAATVPFNVT